MRSLFKALAVGALALGLSAPAMAQDKVIKMGTMAWEDLVPISEISKKVLEDKGFTVEMTEFSEWGIAYAALTKGDVEILVSQIDYVAQDYWQRNMSRLEKISPVSHGLADGIAVPDYVPLESIEQLNENVDKFNGKIIGIEPGAGLMRETGDVIAAYDLDFQLIEGSSAGMAAALKAAIDREEWIAVTMWKPSWMAMKFPIHYLDDPKGIYPPPQTYYWIGQSGFSEANPEAREILAGIFVPTDDITAINGAVSDGATMQGAIADWIDNHADLISRWEAMKSY